MGTAERVIKNTGFLYAKMGITMFVSLYTTRLVLNALGASDFGIFSIVGGAIAMLGFLNASMASATQRFMSYAEGEGDKEKQRKIFNISFVLHIGIACVLGVALLVAGYFFFNGVLNIEESRMYAAKVVYASLIISTMLTVMTVPYDAILNAHENMLYYGIVGVVESFLKLAVAFFVVYYIGDQLILYGVLMACIPVLTMTAMRIYCHRKYAECVIAPRKYWDKELMRKIGSFAGWSFLTSSTGIVSQYGMGIVLNSFFGTILNTAQAIANQVSGQLMVFSNTMLKAVNPVITKSEGRGNRALMLNTSLQSSKFAFLMLAFFALPFILETPTILKFWLGDVPVWTILFVRLQLIRSLIEQLTVMLGVSISATGDIKMYAKVKSCFNILPIIMTLAFFYYGFPPYFLYIVWIFFGGILGGIVAVFFAHIKCDLVYSDFGIKVIIPCLVTASFMLLLGSMPFFFMDSSILRFFFVTVATTIGFLLSLFFVLRREEKAWLWTSLNSVKDKVKFV